MCAADQLQTCMTGHPTLGITDRNAVASDGKDCTKIQSCHEVTSLEAAVCLMELNWSSVAHMMCMSISHIYVV